jgi:RNA polymerase sigma-70 factor (ECF subfamily)
MEAAMRRLAAEQTASGKGASYELLRAFLSREPEPGEYTTIAERLNVAPGTLAVPVHRLRERYRNLVRAAVADTVESPLEVDAEMHHLLEAVGGR